MALIIRLLAATLCIIHLSVAEECRKTASVLFSAKDLDTNVNEGGHLWQHIAGLKETPKSADKKATQSGKLMFPSKAEFDEVLKRLGKLEGVNFASCPSNHKKKDGKKRMDKVLASKLGVKTVVQCIKVDKITKVCTNTKDVDMTGKYIEFYYLWKKRKWVLLTAFPRIFSNNKKIKKKINVLPHIAWNRIF